MGFTSSEIQRLTFKVQAGNVIDAASGAYWYESRFPNNPAILSDRVLRQFDIVKNNPAANLSAAKAAASANPSIIEDITTATDAIRLTQAVPGGNNTWAAYSIYDDRESEVKDLWIQPQRVPLSSGAPSNGYAIQLYSGDPNNGGVFISTTIGQSGGEVGWVFNYDMGLLFLANDLISTIQNDNTTYPDGLDFYILGFRYIGETGVGGGGEGDTVIPGPGIEVTEITDGTVEVSVNLDPYQDNIQINTAGEVTFDGIGIQDEGIDLGNYRTVNFIGEDVLALDSGSPHKVNVFIPTPTFASHFDTTDGTTTGTVGDNINTPTVRISTPTTEGDPFSTGGWAGTNRPSTISTNVTYATAQQVTGLSETSAGDSTVSVSFYGYNSTGNPVLLDSYTSPVLYQDGTNTSSSNNISVTVSNYEQDSFKWKGKLSISCNTNAIFSDVSEDGGRYYVEIIHNTDTETDGGQTFTFTSGDVFYDTNLTTPSINGNPEMIISESTRVGANINVKHLSGVEYYILNSEFEVAVNDIDNLNQNTQGFNSGVTKNFTITAGEYGLPTKNIKFWDITETGMSATGWSNNWNQDNVDFDYDRWPITATNYRYRGATANGTSQVFDPWGSGTQRVSPNEKLLIDTVTASSTNLGEDFDDESERLIRGSTSYTSWDSESTLGTSVTLTAPTATTGCDACIVGDYLLRPDQFYLGASNPTSGTLVNNDLPNYEPSTLGTNPDYSGSSYQTTSVYHRKFYTSSANETRPIANFQLTFEGLFGADSNATTALSNENLKIYIRKVSGAGSTGFNANPLALHGGLFNSDPQNPYNDGASGVDTPGSLIRTGSSSGNSVDGTFGGDNAVEGFWIEVQILNSDIKIDTINCEMVFAGGTPATESNPV